MIRIILLCFLLMGAKLYNTETTFNHDFATTNVTKSAWVEVKTDIGTRVSSIEVFQTSGQPLYFGFTKDSTDPSSNQLTIHPVGIDKMNFSIPPNGDLFLKAVSESATAGTIYFNLFNEPGTVVDR